MHSSKYQCQGKGANWSSNGSATTATAPLPPPTTTTSDGGDGFSSCARIWGECLTIQSPPVLFFFFKWRLAHAN